MHQLTPPSTSAWRSRSRSTAPAAEFENGTFLSVMNGEKMPSKELRQGQVRCVFG